MRKILVWLTSATTVLALAACSPESGSDGRAAATAPSAAPATEAPTSEVPATDAPVDGKTPINITAGDQMFEATLNDSQVSKDFAAMLPITLPWSRSSGIEYITELDAALTRTGPSYTDVQPGDLLYYSPRNIVAMVYAETSSVPNLTKMGEITPDDLEAIEALPDDVDMTIERR